VLKLALALLVRALALHGRTSARLTSPRALRQGALVALERHALAQARVARREAGEALGKGGQR
jgi:hypothetical protein